MAKGATRPSTDGPMTWNALYTSEWPDHLTSLANLVVSQPTFLAKNLCDFLNESWKSQVAIFGQKLIVKLFLIISACVKLQEKLSALEFREFIQSYF